MNKNKIKSIEDTMNDVISTSRRMRDYLLNEEVEFEERAGKLKIFKTALEANKNIVSASVVRINIEEFRL